MLSNAKIWYLPYLTQKRVIQNNKRDIHSDLTRYQTQKHVIQRKERVIQRQKCVIQRENVL